MKLEGTVLGIVYYNEENGYTVLDFDAEGRFVTAVGIFPMTAAGEMLAITGEFKENARYGEQFAVTEVEFLRPKEVDAVERYLASGLFKGIGEKLAREIVSYFGTRTLDVLDNSPENLRKVPGIGKKKLAEIISSYRESKNMKESILFLQRCEVSMNLSMKIIRQYGEHTVACVSANPYQLVEDIDGVGFLTADKIAARVGVAASSMFRLSAGLLHTLKEAAGRGGHTALPTDVLIQNTAKLTGVEDRAAIEHCLAEQDNIHLLTVDGVEMAATRLNYGTENAISARILMLNKSKQEFDIDIVQELNHYERSAGITLHEKQREAVESIFSHGVSIVTGGPGTGKTTIIKGMTYILGARGLRVTLCAPTGRASKRMSEATGESAMTIHRLLGAEHGAEYKFARDESNPLDVDVLIVDEISMADIFIFHALLKAVPNGARVVLVGDKDQLPSVSCGNILSDIIESGLINTVFLKEIYRQGKESMIVVNAHRINEGQMPILKGAHDFFMDRQVNPRDMLSSVVSLVKERLPKFLGLEPSDIQVLAPMKKGVAGVENINLELQNALNPHGRGVVRNGVEFRVGDKVMQTVNNYNIEWVRDGYEHGSGIFNGDIGYINSIFPDKVEVLFEDGKLVSYGMGELEELMLAYCVSVHKAQGSEFPAVVIAVTAGSYMILTKNLLYTAVTRARRLVVIVGDEENVGRMVRNQYTEKRYSLLKYFLLQNEIRLSILWGTK